MTTITRQDPAFSKALAEYLSAHNLDKEVPQEIVLNSEYTARKRVSIWHLFKGAKFIRKACEPIDSGDTWFIDHPFGGSSSVWFDKD